MQPTRQAGRGEALVLIGTSIVSIPIVVAWFAAAIGIDNRPSGVFIAMFAILGLAMVAGLALAVFSSRDALREG